MQSTPVVGLWHDRDFRLYWASRAVSMLGSAVTYVALPVLVYRTTGSASWTGFMTALGTLPYVLFGLVGGVLGDRLERRRLMVAADVVAACAIGSIVVAHFANHLTIAHLMVAAFVAASASTIFDGANWGALPVLVGRDDLPRANAAVYGTTSIFDAAGPAIVGLALAAVTPGSLLIIDAASFAASALMLRAISSTMSTTAPKRLSMHGLRRDVADGLGYLWHHPQLRPMTLVTMCGSAGSAGLLSVTVVWCARVLHVGTSGWRLGAVYATWGVGAFIASLLLVRALRRSGALTVTRAVLPIVTALAAILACVRSFPAAIVVLMAYVILHTLQFTAVVTWRQQVIPDELLSRVASAARLVGWGAAATVGALIAGPVAEGFGVTAALCVVAALHALGAVLSWQPALLTTRQRR